MNSPRPPDMKTCPRFLMYCTALVAVTAVLGGCNKPAAGIAGTQAASQTGSNVADIDVTTNVKTALLQDPALKGADIRVETSKGDVRLIGVLDSQSQIDAAIKVARAADGAHTIHDELTVKK